VIIEAVGLTKEFAGKQAVNGLSSPSNREGHRVHRPQRHRQSTTLQLMLGLVRGGGPRCSTAGHTRTCRARYARSVRCWPP
jgi:hypothetical protein